MPLTLDADFAKILPYYPRLSSDESAVLRDRITTTEVVSALKNPHSHPGLFGINPVVILKMLKHPVLSFVILVVLNGLLTC